MTTIAQKAADWAAATVRKGLPYRMRAAGPDAFDCSGLVVAAYKAVSGGKIRLDHNTVLLRRALKPVRHYTLLRPGDVVFYYDALNPSHCAIYTGRTGKVGSRVYWVAQATNEARGLETIRMSAYAKPTSYGRVRRGQKEA